MDRSRRVTRDVVTFLIIFGLLVAVNFLPPDTSFAQVKESGVLRACVPTQYPPLVTQDPQMPGIDVEILRTVADELDLRLSLNTNSAMGRDFNPRNWRVTRAQCQVLAGGVVGSQTTRSFLETTPAYLETGWALVLPNELETLSGSTLGFYAGISGLDRIALSRFLREQGVRAVTVNSTAELVAGLAEGRFAAGVTEALNARQIAGDNDWQVQWLPEDLGRYPVVLGLWKGDLTLKRELVAVLERLERQGLFNSLLERYEIVSITSTCTACEAAATKN